MDIQKWLSKFSTKTVTDSDLVKAIKKAGNLSEQKDNFLLLISMFKDVIAGKYKIPTKSLVSIGAAILYVISPIDAIPDIFLGGFIDDIAIVGYIMNSLSKEIEEYKKTKGV